MKRIDTSSTLLVGRVPAFDSNDRAKIFNLITYSKNLIYNLIKKLNLNILLKIT